MIWEGPEPLEADSQCELNSFIAMDHWLGAVAKDKRKISLPQKIIRDKPVGPRRRVLERQRLKVSNGLCPSGVVPVYGTPRTVAGDGITTDANKCELQPLSRSAYAPIQFTDAEWSELQSVFPQGVCNYSKPGVDQRPTVPWLTYQTASGKVIYGGRPLGPAPASKPIPGDTLTPAR